MRKVRNAKKRKPRKQGGISDVETILIANNCSPILKPNRKLAPETQSDSPSFRLHRFRYFLRSLYFFCGLRRWFRACVGFCYFSFSFFPFGLTLASCLRRFFLRLFFGLTLLSASVVSRCVASYGGAWCCAPKFLL